MKLDNFLEFLQRKQFIIYAALFVAFFFLFLLARFPGDFIVDSLIQKFNEKSNVKITYSDVDFSLFSGITFHKLEVSLPRESIKLNSVKLKPSYPSLLRGKLNTFIELKDPAGKLHGYISMADRKTSLDLTIKNFDLSFLNPLKDKLKVKLSGTVRGKIKLTFPGRWEKSKGLIVLEGDNIIASDNPYIAMLGKSSFPLGALNAMGRIANGKLKIETFRLGEKNYYIKLGGEITLKTPIVNSMLNLQVKLKLDNLLQEKIGPLLPAVGFARTPGGIYTKKIYGRLSFLFR